jgi:hypothetical protein
MGSQITNYKLYRNDVTSIVEIGGYDYSRDGYLATVNYAQENMQVGLFYTFSYLAQNVNGDSQLSAELSVPVADAPTKANSPIMT